MSMLGIKSKGSSMRYLTERTFSDDQKEEYLHRIAEQAPRLIFGESGELCEGEPVLLASRLTLPSRKEADLLFCSPEGELFIVELKRDKSPRDVVAQLLDYSSSLSEIGIDAFLKLLHTNLENLRGRFSPLPEWGEERLIQSLINPSLLIVSYKVDQDILRVTKYLRERDIKINCVEFDYYKEKEEEIFVCSVIDSEQTQKIKEKTFSKTQKIHFDFFSELIEGFKKEKLGVTNKGSTSGDWSTIPVGSSFCHLEWNLLGVNPNKTLEVGLHLEYREDKEKNELILNKLLIYKDELSKELERQKIVGGVESGDWMKKGWKKIIINIPTSLVQNLC